MANARTGIFHEEKETVGKEGKIVTYIVTRVFFEGQVVFSTTPRKLPADENRQLDLREESYQEALQGLNSIDALRRGALGN